MKYFFLVLLLLLSSVSLAETEGTLTILHTNDLHSHFEGSGPDFYFTPQTKDKDPIKGHYARLAFKIQELREQKRSRGTSVLVVDSGDFFAGSLFHVLAPSIKNNVVPELEFFKTVGYDAFTLGNHEFDAGEVGLKVLLEKAKPQGLLDGLVLSNTYFQKKASPLEKIIQQVPSFKIKPLDLNGQKLRIAILGMIGMDAAKVSSVNRSNLSIYGFDDAKSSAAPDQLFARTQALVNSLRKEQKADLVLLLYHGGDKEDETLAQKVDGIDVIVAGHTHQVYQQPKLINNTLIVQAGSYGEYLGQLDLKIHWKNGNPSLALDHYHLNLMDDSVPADPLILKQIESYKKLIPDTYFKNYDYGTPIARITKGFERTRLPNDPYGQWVTTALLEEINKTATDPIDLYMTSMSLIRENLVLINDQPTIYQFSDIFRMFSIGFNQSDSLIAGAPIVSFYMQPKEFVELMNFMEIYRFVSGNFVAAYSKEVHYRIRDWGIPFLNRLADISLKGKPRTEWPKLLHVATNEYVANFLPLVKNLSLGVVELHFRNKQGTIIDKPFRENCPPEPILFSNYLKKQSAFSPEENPQ